MTRTVTLYSRPGCHLCDDVHDDLDLLQAELDIRVDVVNIDTEPEAFRRYRYLIPVVDIEDGPVLTPPITRGQLYQALTAGGDPRSQAREAQS